jgi:flagellar assembly factor FliW
MIAVAEEQVDMSSITIATSRFGDIEVEQDKIITMTTPFLGFPEDKQFVIRSHSKDSPFMWFQSVNNPELAFVVMQATTIIPDYKPAVPQSIKKELHIENTDHDTLLVLTIPNGKPLEMTANLLGPIIINPTRKLSCQLLLDPNKFDPCWPVFARAE